MRIQIHAELVVKNEGFGKIRMHLRINEWMMVRERTQAVTSGMGKNLT